MTSGESSDESAASTGERPPVAQQHAVASASRPPPPIAAPIARPSSLEEHAEAERAKAAAKKAHRGFQRYQAVRDQAWQQALDRQRQGHDHAPFGSVPTTMRSPQGYMLQRPREPEAYYQAYGADRDGGAGPSGYQARQVHDAHEAHPSGATQDIPPHSYRVGPDRVTARGSQVPAYHYEKDQGQRKADSDGNGHRPIVGSRSAFRSSPGLHTVVVSRPPPEELKDYLLPSIEATSPLASQFSAQTLEDRRRDERCEHWQSRPTLQHGETESQHASSQVPDVGFIRVYRHTGEAGRAEPMPHAYSHTGAVGPREKGLIRPAVRDPVSHRPMPMANSNYYRENPAPSFRNDYRPADDTYSRQEDARATLAQTHRVVYGAAPQSRWLPVVPDDGSGARYRDAARPIVVEDERTWREPYRPHAAPATGDGNGARYRDASRPIVVEDEHTWRGPYRSDPAPVPVKESKPVLAQRSLPGEREEYIGRPIQGRMNPHDEASEVDRYPLDFIPVSNMFPRPHEPQGRRYEAHSYTNVNSSGAIMGGPFQAPAGNRSDQRYFPDTRDSRDNLPRQERVVRYEFVNHGYV